MYSFNAQTKNFNRKTGGERSAVKNLRGDYFEEKHIINIGGYSAFYVNICYSKQYQRKRIFRRADYRVVLYGGRYVKQYGDNTR